MHSLTKPDLSVRRAATIAIIFALVASLVAIAPPALGADGDLNLLPPVVNNTLDLGDIRADAEGRSKSRNLVTLQNGGSADITITDISISGTNAGQFSRESLVLPTIGGGETFAFWVQFAPTTAGAKSAVLSIENNGNIDPLVIDLDGRGVTTDVWYRVNAGGNFRQGIVDWVRDSPSVPSPYLNAIDIGNGVAPPTANIEADGTVPSGTPVEVFEAHRHDPPGLDDMAWNFPVDPGTYEVRLYFAETEPFDEGDRVFDVILEGEVMLNDFDIVDDAGQATGTMRGELVHADDVIDIDFGRVTQNPLISGIEIIARPENPDPGPIGEVSSLGASTSSVTFGTEAVGDTVSQTVTLTNQGDENDTSITLDASLSGSDSPNFAITSGGGATTISPGDSTQVVVAFTPKSSGSKSATLVIGHDGTNAPLQVNLTGTGEGASGPGTGFIDIAGSTFITEINWLAETGITKGCNPPTNNLFCPDDFVTRGQMSAFLHRALDDVLTPGEPVEFVDDNGNTFEADIEWLGATGVTRGCNPPTNDRFCPDDFVTRGQMSAFLHRALDDVLTPGAPVEFNDDNDSTFEADIEWLGATGVTRGCNPPTNDRFCPDEPVTREQMAAFLYRALSGE